MAIERGQNDCHLEAEGDGNGLLQIAAARHGRVAVTSGQSGERFADGFEIVIDQSKAFANLEDGGRIGDVLRGGAPMSPFA